MVLARKEDRKGFLNLFAVIKTSIFGGKYRYCPEMLMTEGKRHGKSRKRNTLNDTFGRNSFTLLLGPVVVVGRDDHSLGFAVRAMHSRSLSRFEPGLGKFEVAWEVGWNCCEVVTRMSPRNTGVF